MDIVGEKESEETCGEHDSVSADKSSFACELHVQKSALVAKLKLLNFFVYCEGCVGLETIIMFVDLHILIIDIAQISSLENNICHVYLLSYNLLHLWQ